MRALERVADIVVELYGSELDRNERGVATLCWPGAPTMELRRYLVGAWIRSQTVCDRRAQRERGFYVWPEDAWWRGYVNAAIHCAQYGPRDIPTAFIFDNSGRKRHPRALTFIAKTDHTLRAFEGTEDLALETLDYDGIIRIPESNCTLQLRLFNELIKSDDVSSLVAMAQHNRRMRSSIAPARPKERLQARVPSLS